jgi:plasmid rolling circle replication initiator protein Rep
MQKYNEYKKASQDMYGFVEKFVTAGTLERFKDCGNYLLFISDYDVTKYRLVGGYTCQWAFCPFCEMRKAIRNAIMISAMMEYIRQVHNKEFVFLTLTAPNVKADKLGEEITMFNKAFGLLFDQKEIRDMNHGYIRKLEVTYNKDRDDYHPHFHVVIAVNRGYFSGGRYIKRKRWLELWQKCMKDESITQVDVRKIKRKVDERTMTEGFDMREIAKYFAKVGDYTQNEKVFKAFYSALYRRQRLTFAGMFKDTKLLYEDGKLDGYIPEDTTVYFWEIAYKWMLAEYVEKARRELDKGDALFFSRRGIDTEVADE